MNDQIPLYLGIPLATLCVAAAVGFILLIVGIWRGKL